MRYVIIASCIPVLSTTDIEVHKLSMLMLIIVFHYARLMHIRRRMNKVVVYLQDGLIMIECRYSHCCNINARCYMFILLGRK